MGEEARGRMVESNKKRDDSSPRLNNDDAHMRAVSPKSVQCVLCVIVFYAENEGRLFHLLVWALFELLFHTLT